jgi:redox-sensitive bicupin YhaK (pirin superfamily)
MRSIKKIHKSEYRPISDLVTYSPMPTRDLDQIDPFIFLNHHGFQVYPTQNQGLPFGPHPHRGMETVTFIIAGDIVHKDSVGHESVITSGGVQYMTAGRGLIHSEVSSEDFKKNGGDLEILQLWLNLPASKKMAEPRYTGLQKEEINTFELDGGRIRVQQLFGEWEGNQGSFDPSFDLTMSTIYFQKEGGITLTIPKEKNIFCYLVRGELSINTEKIHLRHLVEFNNEKGDISFQADEESILIFGYAAPFNEPMVAQGPFVMNTQEEIYQAYEDYQNGKFS